MSDAVQSGVDGVVAFATAVDTRAPSGPVTEEGLGLSPLSRSAPNADRVAGTMPGRAGAGATDPLESGPVPMNRGVSRR